MQRLGPLPCEVLYLAWLGASTLLAGCAAGLHLWLNISTPHADQGEPALPTGIALPSPPDLVYSAFAASSRAGHVAASTANTQQVLVWRKVAGNKSSISEPVILDSYKNEVRVEAMHESTCKTRIGAGHCHGVGRRGAASGNRRGLHGGGVGF